MSAAVLFGRRLVDSLAREMVLEVSCAEAVIIVKISGKQQDHYDSSCSPD